jgi:hypothetical protein
MKASIERHEKSVVQTLCKKDLKHGISAMYEDSKKSLSCIDPHTKSIFNCRTSLLAAIVKPF